ncbi:hypothetical protein AB9K17_24220, partial [Salmonella enterica subsp. enterica serovar Kentucky]|uniref:hypothetical protein n=1 Tax=Salmonella enterica TaxID=28901 RepID=UPI003F4B574F
SQGILVSYMVSGTGGFIASAIDTAAVHQSRALLTSGTDTLLEIPTQDPTGNIGAGTITVTLLDGAGYTLG